MTLLTNPNFIDQIVRSLGAEGRFDPADISTLALFCELQLRHLIETAIKYSTRDRRDVVEVADVVEGARELGHPELLPETICNYSCQSSRGEDSVWNAQQLVESELGALDATLSGPCLDGRWILIRGKIPVLSENRGLRTLSQIQERQQSQRKKFVNVIKDDPYSLLTREQIEYFQKMCVGISDDVNPQGNFTVEGDINNLVPFFLKFLGQGELNDTGVWFLLRLIDNKHVWAAIEYYLKKVLSLLLGYRGEHSFQVGVKIAQLVDRFSDKYPLLRDIFDHYSDQSYSTLLKRIPFELHLGIPLEVQQGVLGRCKAEAERGDKIAVLCMQALLSYASQLKVFREFLMKKMNTYVYWHPCAQLKNDPYLRMF